MTFIERVDPELARILETIPFEDFRNWQDLPATRVAAGRLFAARTAHIPNSSQVAKEDRTIPGPAGAPAVSIRIYRPVDAADTLPCLVWIHGGGYVLGSIEIDDHAMQHLVEVVGCVVVSVEYRLAPEHPFPAAIDDCYAALTWTIAHAEELRIDPSRIALGGASAGGGLAAGLVLLARDRGDVPLVFQLLVYPMLDDRSVTPSSQAITDPRVWNREANHNGWRAYLHADPGSEGISPYASATRAADVRNLPPAYIAVGTQDLFVDEDIAYAQRLIEAGVPVELHVYPGAFHGSENVAPAAALSQRMVADRLQALDRALRSDAVPSAIPPLT